MRKLIIALITFIFIINSSAYAFSFKKNNHNPLNVQEKTEYVNMCFWDKFQDEYLNYYITEAIRNNPDARKASWQVEEYRQNVKYSFGQELPSLSVSANYAGIHVPRFDNFELDQNAFILPFIASYEPDFLLKNRDRTKSVKKAYEAEKYLEKSVYISLASDVATAYVNVILYDKLISYQNEIIKIKQAETERVIKKFQHGIIDRREYNAILKEYETAKNNLETYEKNRITALTQLAVLAGISADCAKDLKRSDFDSFDYHGKIPAQILSDVIFSRPDVMAAEKNLEKAKIDIRVARKEFLPGFRITGIYAFNTIAPGNFFSWESTLAAVLAGATQDIFKGGQKLANLRIKKAKYEQLFEDYRKTDLNAVKEINDALCIIKTDTEIDKNTINYLNIQKNDFILMQKKFSRGISAYTDILNEQEKLFLAAQNQTQTKAARLVNYFTLYKAVGGQL